MTRDEIIRIGRKYLHMEGEGAPYFELELFAYDIATAEREACAQVCEEQGSGRRALEHYAALTYSGAAFECAVAIRARGNT